MTASSDLPVINVSSIIEHADPRKLLYPVLIWCCLIMLVDGADLALLALAGPSIMTEWHISRATFGQILAAGQFGTVSGALLLGLLADRYGRRRVILGAVAVFGLLTLCVPLIPSPLGLAVLRLITCCAIGGVKGTVYSLALESCPERSRGKIVGIVFAGYSIGQIGIALVAGFILGTLGWPTLFAIGGGGALVVAALAWRGLPESLRFQAVNPQHHPALTRRLQAWGVEAADDAKFALGDERQRPNGRFLSPAPLFEGNLRWITPLLWVTEILAILVTSFYLNWTPTLALDLGAHGETASFALAAFSLGGLFGPLAMGQVLDRRGIGYLPAAPLLAAVAVAVTALAVRSDVAVLGAMFIVGFLVMGVYLSLAGLAFRFYPSGVRASAAGWYMFVGGLGSVSGPVLVGWLMAGGVTSRELMLFSAAPLAAIVPLGAVIARRFAQSTKHLVSA